MRQRKANIRYFDKTPAITIVLQEDGGSYFQVHKVDKILSGNRDSLVRVRNAIDWLLSEDTDERDF